VADPAPVAEPAPEATPEPTPGPKPAKGKLRLSVKDVHRLDGRKLALTRDTWRVRGVARPYVEGQTVTVRFFRNGRQVHEQVEKLQPIRDGRAGEFRSAFRSRSAGKIKVKAAHAATPELAKLRAKPVKVRVLEPDLGGRGTLVRLLQRGLARMHYAVSRSGTYDSATARAVMAWRKVNGQPRTYSATPSVVRAVLAGRGEFRVRYPGDGRHVEADISRQVLALVRPGGKLFRVYHTSTGAPATPTVLGRFRVYRKDTGTNALGMVHSSYFIRGYAIHGYMSVPPFNASHGCLRVPIPDAWFIYSQVRMGDVVRVYP
jgi:lipoprotein-anchoring transpeptidase ErfK/SrfK